MTIILTHPISTSSPGADTFTRTEVIVSSYTITNNDLFIGVLYSITGPTTLIMPTNPVPGDRLFIKDEGGNSEMNNIIINTVNNNLIDDNLTITLSINYISIQLIWTGYQWSII